MMRNYPTNLTDSQWQFIVKILNDQRKRSHSLREVWNAIIYLVKTGCQWRMLPHDYPHWSAVYYYFKKWKENGLFEEILDNLDERERKLHKKKSSPVWVPDSGMPCIFMLIGVMPHEMTVPIGLKSAWHYLWKKEYAGACILHAPGEDAPTSLKIFYRPVVLTKQTDKIKSFLFYYSFTINVKASSTT